MLGRFLSDERLLELVTERGLVDHLDDDVILEQLVEREIAGHLDDETLIQACDTRDIARYQDPVDELESLPDRRGTVYAWVVPDNRVEDWHKRLLEYDEAANGLDALHVVITPDDDIRRLDIAELNRHASL